jgi:hypothetical protein
MRKRQVNLLEAYEVSLYINGAYAKNTQALATELVHRGLGDQLEDLWVSYMAEREGVLEIGCEFDGKF